MFEFPLNNHVSSHGRNQLSLPLGSAIKSMRRRQGKPEVQISKASNVERSHLSRIERNVLTPNFDTVLRILRGLGADTIFIHMPKK